MITGLPPRLRVDRVYPSRIKIRFESIIDLEIEVQVESVELGTVKDAICRRLADVLGETVRVRVSPKSDLEPVPGTKFRVVESRVAQTPASA